MEFPRPQTVILEPEAYSSVHQSKALEALHEHSIGNDLHTCSGADNYSNWGLTLIGPMKQVLRLRFVCFSFEPRDFGRVNTPPHRKQTKDTQTYIHIHIHIHVYIYTHTYISRSMCVPKALAPKTLKTNTTQA